MKTSRLFLIALQAVMLAAALAACQPKVKLTPITGAERDAVLAYADPKTDYLLKGLATVDYATFSRDFDDTMKSKLTEAEFAKMQQQIAANLGAYDSRTVRDVNSSGDYVIVDYAAKFEKKDVVMRVVFEPAGQNRISGLFFY